MEWISLEDINLDIIPIEVLIGTVVEHLLLEPLMITNSLIKIGELI